MEDLFVESLSWMEFLIEKAETTDEPDIPKFTHSLCVASRELHVDVWARCFKLDVVRENVVGVMKLVDELFENFLNSNISNEDKQDIVLYKRNNIDRLENITENKLNGLPSAFGPNAKLRELANTGLEMAS